MSPDVVPFPDQGADRAEPPDHLSETMREWWRETVREFVLDSHHLQLLRRACEAWDVAEEARRELQEDGSTVEDRFGQKKPHPSAGVWRDNAGLFQRLVRENGLDAQPDDSRPPRQY